MRLGCAAQAVDMIVLHHSKTLPCSFWTGLGEDVNRSIIDNHRRLDSHSAGRSLYCVQKKIGGSASAARLRWANSANLLVCTVCALCIPLIVSETDIPHHLTFILVQHLLMSLAKILYYSNDPCHRACH